LLYMKPEFNLDATPALEGLVVASTLIGAVASVTVAGPSADWLGRKTMLCVSGVLFSVAALIMSWAPTVYILIMGRILVGSAIGLAATIAPILISESAPAEIRGQLATLPQLMGSGGLFLAYVMDFALSLQTTVNWRFMLGILSVPSIMYVLVGVLFLPESPRWLVSKGRMLEAKTVLQNLRDREDVTGELALLVEGLGVGGETQLEEWLLKPADRLLEDDEDSIIEEGQIKVFGPDESSWFATPIADESGSHGLPSRRTSIDIHALPLIDPMVTMLGSFQTPFDYHSTSGDIGTEDHDLKTGQWDEEAHTLVLQHGDKGYHSENDLGMVTDSNETLQVPLLSGNKLYGSAKNLPPFSHNGTTHGLVISRSNSRDRSGQISPLAVQSNPHHSQSNSKGFSDQFSRSNSRRSAAAHDGGVPESFGNVGIGAGWQLAWRWDEGGPDGQEGGLKRVFLRGDGGELLHFTSSMSLPGAPPSIGEPEAFQAAVLVGHSAQYEELIGEHPVGPAMIHPAETATKLPALSNLLEGGVQRALIVGVGLQILQQLSGINAVLYFTPQILMQSGAGDLLANVGIDGESASILASGVTCFLMLPCILMAMWLMDRSGRRQLLLATIPILAISLVALVLVNMLLTTGLIPAAVSFTCVTIFTCSFVAGFGPIPNILCSEIFPTRVRGVCIGLCAAAMWVSNVIITYSFPLLNQQFGLQGVFGLFAVASVIAWLFVFVKVPETKGLPLEIISEFFAVAPKKEKDQNDF
jgi:MFS family permease